MEERCHGEEIVMIEIEYSKSDAGADNFFHLYHIHEYIPMFSPELLEDGLELKFYLSLFRKFNIIEKDASGISFWWNTRFYCKYNEYEFTMVYDNDYGFVDFCVEGKFIKNRETIAEAIKSLVETEGRNVVIDHNIDIYDLNKALFNI